MDETKIRAALGRIQGAGAGIKKDIANIIDGSTSTAHSMAAEVHLGAFLTAIGKHVDHVAPLQPDPEDIIGKAPEAEPTEEAA